MPAFWVQSYFMTGWKLEHFTWKINDDDVTKGRKITSTSNLSSLALCFFGSNRNSSVNRIHSSTFSGDTKSSATFMQDWKIDQTCNQEKDEKTNKNTVQVIKKRFIYW